MKVQFFIPEEIIKITNEILSGRTVVINDKKLVHKLSYHMRPLRQKDFLMVARDNHNKKYISVVALKVEQPEVEQKSQVFGGYLMETIFPKRRKTFPLIL